MLRKNSGKMRFLLLLTSISLVAFNSWGEAASIDSISLNAESSSITSLGRPRKPSPVAGKPSPAPTHSPKPISGGGQPTAGDGGAPIQDSSSVIFDTCFSPNGACDQKLIDFIKNSHQSLSIAIYSITHSGISQAIIDAKNRNVSVRMVVDKSQSNGKSSQVDALRSAGIDLKIGNFSGIMHDKFTISDGAYLETGSYNYSDNATNNNGENQLYLNDQNVIQRYQENFDQMFQNGLAN